MSRLSNHWEGLEPNPDCFFGFIYLIENTVNGRLYVGKKQYWAATGNFRNRSSHISTDKWRPEQWKPSDWNYYTGSSRELNADIKKFGKDKFRFIILSQHSTKGDLHYEEIKEQAVRNVLAEKLTEDVYLYYNKSIAAIKFRPPDHHSDSTKKKFSLAKSGEKNPQFGKPHSESTKEKISFAKKGKTCTKETREKMSLAKRGKILTKETRKKLSLANRKHFLARTGFSSQEELEAAVFKNYEKTKSTRKTAKEMKISRTAVWKIIQKHNKEPKET